MRFFVLVSFICGSFTSLNGQPTQISVGVLTGITSPYTFDSGINRDSRYQQRYQVKLAPVGISYGVDYQGYGFVITPSLINIGQNMNIINNVGGYEGTRSINMQYVQVPIGFKLHMIDLAFFKVSLIAGAGAGYLIKGNETVTHRYAKYRFPAEVLPILPSDYVVEYDGVIAPEIKKLEIVSKDDFKPFQFFGSLGFRSDWDFKKSWRVAFDLRANYGFTEPRSDAYLVRAKENQTLYDLSGERRELFASLNIGIARYLEVNKQKTKPFGTLKRRKR
ncbi:MAG TPA: outer membrane beta-barrel protein [Chryseosolibacter sp.]